MKFIDGLRADIRSIVLLQRPKDLDTACLLASLQEEVTDPTRSKEVKKSSPYLVSAVRGAHPLTPPPIYIWGGSLPPRARRQAPCRQLERRQGAAAQWGAAGSLQGLLRKTNLFLFMYMSLPPPCWAVGPLPPPAGRQGYRTVKPKTKNIFL